MSLDTVARVAKRRSKPDPGPPEKGRKPMVVQLRGSEEFKAWAERLARFDSLPLASLVERALRRYAREIGFKEEAPER